MIRLIYLAVLCLSCLADPKSPRIYNVLISSKKNLSPSHAQPVYEPVLRTTSIGYAFPSLFYHTSFVQNVPVTYINPDYSGLRKLDNSFISQKEEEIPNTMQLPSYAHQPFNQDQKMTVSSQPQLTQEVSKEPQENEPAPVEHFIPQYDPYALNYANYLPRDQESASAESNRAAIVQQQQQQQQQQQHQQQQQVTDPKQVIANLKKNPGIPDVPPPPLPVKVSQSA